MRQSWISVPTANGQKFDAYLSLPPTGSGPGILLLQEIFGVNEHIRAVADQYASDGFTVLAPDIFWQDTPRLELDYNQQGFERGLGLLGQLNIENAAADMKAAVHTLKKHEACTGKVASVGFCMGGLLSFVAAASAGVDSAVCYYGGGIHQHLDLAKKIKCPVLFHFAEKDSYIPADAVALVKNAMAGRSNVRLIVHPNVDHGFNCWRRPAWHQNTAATARGQTLVHIAETLA
jgi:carboxymethylenebutenolidase